MAMTPYESALIDPPKYGMASGLPAEATQSPYEPALIDPSKYGTASDLAAAVTQSQYDNWKSTYFPAMQAALDMTTYKNPELINTEVQKGMAAAGQASINAAGQQSRAFGRFGMQPTPEQQTAIEQATNSNKALSEVDASNKIRMNLNDRNKTIMAGNVANFQAKV